MSNPTPTEEDVEQTKANKAAQDIASYDLTSTVSPFLDLHMMFPLLEYIESLILSANTNGNTNTSGNFNSSNYPYSTKDVALARLNLLRPTHMVDYAMDIYRELHFHDTTAGTDTTTIATMEDIEIPQEMIDQKQKVLEMIDQWKIREEEEGCKAFDDLCMDDVTRTKLLKTGEWNIPSLHDTSKTHQDKPITEEVIETYKELAKFHFDCGDYQTSKIMLSNIISLYAIPPLPTTDDDNDNNDDLDGLDVDLNDDSTRKGGDRRNEEGDKIPTSSTSTLGQKTGNPNVYYLTSTSVSPSLLRILWGKFSCEILVEGWEEASRALVAVKLSIEQLVYLDQMTAIEALTQRTWLLHWSLFVYWNEITGSNSGAGGVSGGKGSAMSKGKGLESMVDLFFSEKYLQAITTNAPHLLRYLTAAVLLTKRRISKSNKSSSSSSPTADARKLMKDLVKLMNNCEYTDPIVEFVDCLCVKFDFDLAQQKLLECESVLSTDFFLCQRTNLFMEEARVFIFENYCRIHEKVSIHVLATKLAMDQESAEHWIVDLIRNATLLDAKIDSENGCVVMGHGGNTTQTSLSTYHGGNGDYGSSTSVYEQVMNRTRDLNLRTSTMAQNLKNFVSDVKKERTKRERAILEG